MDSIKQQQYIATFWIGDIKAHRREGSLLAVPMALPFYYFTDSVFSRVDVEWQGKRFTFTKDNLVPTVTTI